eukprot:4536-Heterococcus_DN1.PRE.1
MKRERDSPPLPDSSPPPRASPDLQQPAGQPFVWLPQPGLPGYATELPGPPAPQLHNYLPGLAAIGHPAYQQMPYYHPPPPSGYMDELGVASGGGGPGPLPFFQQQLLHTALAMQAAHGVPLQYMPGAAARGLGPVGFGAGSGAASSSIYDGILDPTSIVMPNAPGLGRFAMPMQHLLGGTMPLPLDQYEELKRASLLPGGPLGSTSFPDVSALHGQQQQQQQQQLPHLQPPWQQHDELVAGTHQEWPPPARDHHHQQHQHQSSMLPLKLPAAAAASAASASSASSVLQRPQPLRS